MSHPIESHIRQSRNEIERHQSARLAALVAQTIVRAFSASPSYESTRRRFPLVDLIPLDMFSRDMLDELDAAAEFNDQISEAGLRAPYSSSAPEAVADPLRRASRAPG